MENSLFEQMVHYYFVTFKDYHIQNYCELNLPLQRIVSMQKMVGVYTIRVTKDHGTLSG